MSTTAAVLLGMGLLAVGFLAGRVYQWLRDARGAMGVRHRGRR